MISTVKKITVVVCVSMIGLMSGCASSNLVDIWHEPYFKSPPLGKVLVIAVRKDETKRRVWEDAFASELSKQSMVAVASYSIYPDAPPDTEQIQSAVSTNGFDGILVVLRLPTEKNSHYVKGYTTTEEVVMPMPTRYRNVQYYYQGNLSVDQRVQQISYWQRYRTYYLETNHPGYIDSQTVDIKTIDVTTTGKNGRLVWSGTSRTPDPGTIVNAQSGIAELVVTELAKLGIITPKK